MTPENDAGLLAVARAIAAGEPVDWTTVESNGEIDASFARVLRELRAVAEIAEAHRSLSEVASGSAPSGVTSGEAATQREDIRHWGTLTILEQIGAGAFGKVYRAWDARLEREVALKLLRPVASKQATSVVRSVIHEGRLLARVRHPNVVTVYGADEIDGRVGIWMELIRGRNLEVVLREHGSYGAPEASLIGLDILRALAAVHRSGLMHRDVKAQNVMREDGGRIVLMDFGTGSDMLADERGGLAGTPLYLAPEVFQGGQASPHSDIYSVGVLLYHLVTTSYPLPGRTMRDLTTAHAEQRREWLRDARPDLPDLFVEIVERALAPRPADRYESAGAMAEALARVVSSPQAAAPAIPSEGDAGVVPLRRSETAAHRQRRWFAVMCVALAATSALIVTGVGRFSMDRPASTAGSTVGAFQQSSPQRRRVTLPNYSVLGTPSADGTLLSLADDSGNLALLNLTNGELRHVTRDAVFGKASQYAEDSVISPDRESVAYTWFALDGKYELRMSDAAGTQPRVLVRQLSVEHVRPIEWSRDGSRILAVVTRPDHARELSLVSVPDGEVRRVTQLGAHAPLHASLSPDGAFIVYDYPQSDSASARDILIASSDGAAVRPLVQFPATDLEPVWTPDGQQILFVSDRSGTMDLWSIGVDQGAARGEPVIAQRNIGRILPRGVTDTGGYYYHETTGTADVYEAEVGPAGVQPPRAVPVTYAGSNLSSLWSPDGKRLAYASRRGPARFDRGWTALVIRDIDSGDETVLTPALTSFLLRAWSPDGRFVLVQGADAGGRTGMHRIDVATAAVTPVILNAVSQNDIRRPDWLPDGRLVHINSRRRILAGRAGGSASDEILWDFGADNLDIVANVNGRGYRVSPDVQSVAYTVAENEGKRRTRSLRVRELSSRSTRELLRVAEPDFIQLQDWTPDGAAVLFTRWTADASQPVSLWRIALAGGPPEPTGLAMEGIRDVSVHPDGTRITFTAGWPEAELWVLENFLLKR